MSNSLFLSLTNLLLFVLWLRLWLAPESKLYFNPYLSSIHRLSGKMVAFFEPLLPGFSARRIALLELLFLLFLRAVVQYYFGAGITIELGSLVARGVNTAELTGYVWFSCMGFLFFLARIWLLARLLQWLAGGVQRDRASEAMRFGAIPVSYMEPPRQCTVILLLNMLLAWLLMRTGEPAALMIEQLGVAAPPPPEVSLGGLGTFPVLFFLGLAAAVDTLSLAQNLMLLAVLLNLAGLLMHRPALHGFAREWVHVLLGRFSRYSFGTGGISFAPLVFLLLVPFIRQAIIMILRSGLEALA